MTTISQVTAHNPLVETLDEYLKIPDLAGIVLDYLIDPNKYFSKLTRLAGHVNFVTSTKVQKWCEQINQCTTTQQKVTALITARADFHALVAPNDVLKAQAIVSSCARVRHLTATYREDILLEPVCIISSFPTNEIIVAC